MFGITKRLMRATVLLLFMCLLFQAHAQQILRSTQYGAEESSRTQLRVVPLSEMWKISSLDRQTVIAIKSSDRYLGIFPSPNRTSGNTVVIRILDEEQGAPVLLGSLPIVILPGSEVRITTQKNSYVVIDEWQAP